jgi:hypothetical protein
MGYRMTLAPDKVALDPAPLLAARRALVAAIGALDGLLRLLETPTETLVQRPLKTPLTAHDPLAEHRRQHRAGSPAKLNTDPELRDFVNARLATLTFDQIIAEVAHTFPPDRRISRSSLHRWWKKHRPHLVHPIGDS